jgi:hypothetical protein
MNKSIKLEKPIELHGKKSPEIEIKEPSGALYVKLGDPRLLVFNPSGSGYWIEQNETIKAYLEALLDHPLGGDVVALLSLRDVMALKEALFDFFTSAAERRAATK